MKKLFLGLGVVLPALLLSSAASSSEASLTIGRISTSPRSVLPQLHALADFLAPALAELGLGMEVRVLTSQEAMAQALAEGKVDLFGDNVFIAHQLEASGLAEILLAEGDGRSARHRTLFVARADEVPTSLHDLAGRTVAFQRDSAASHLVPLAIIRRAGFEVRPALSTRPPTAVGYIMTPEPELNMLAAIVRGRADVGFISQRNWNDPEKAPAVFRDQLAVFYQSRLFPRSLVLVRTALPSQVKSRLAERLLAAHLSPEGRAFLTAYTDGEPFSRLDEDDRENLRETRALLAWLSETG